MALSKFTIFGNRYATFSGVNDSIDCWGIASDGLYRDHKGERTTLRCAFCSFQCDSGDSVENCRFDHMRRNPYCFHLCTTHGLQKMCQVLMNANVPVWRYDELRRNLDLHYIQPMLKSSFHKLNFHASTNVEFSSPTNKEMVDFDKRLHTMNSIETRHSLTDIADAGFFYDTYGVVFICYYCGKHVDLHALNRSLDPWRAHLSASWKCFHNILMRGDDFILMGQPDSAAVGHMTPENKRKRSHGQANLGASCQTNAPKSMRTITAEVPDRSSYSVPRERDKPRQRCPCSQMKRNERKHQPHQTLYSRTQNLSPHRPNERCDGPHYCFKCKLFTSNGSQDLLLTLCCHVWVCFECAQIDQCPKCNRSHGEVSRLNNGMECD